MTGFPFGLPGLAAFGVFLSALLILGYRARGARRDESLSDFYLAGRTLGPVVLLATLYATQYSGNSLIGYPGETYRIGFAWIMSVGFMMAIVVMYLALAPRLFPLAARHGYITPGDWIDHRYRTPALTWTANVLWVVAISNYLLAQLMAMGHVTEGITGGAVPYWVGVVVFTLVIIVYESLGGMRAVVWTDALQGLLLIVGLIGVLAVILPTPAHLRELTEWVVVNQPSKAAVPAWDVIVNWASTIVLIGLSGSVYPQAIQRIFAARDLRALKRSICQMAFLPLVTMVPVVLIGIYALQHLSGLSGITADQVMPLILREWTGGSAMLFGLSLAVLIAVLAAIMSSADSVLLSLSSILAKDVLGSTVLKGAPESRLTQVGKRLSWGIVTVLVVIAVVPRITLWGLIEFKMEVLAQIWPAFVLGLHWRRLTGGAVLVAMLIGVAVSIGLTATGHPRVWGVHAGVVGLAANLAACALLSTRWAIRLPARGRASMASAD
ncbi:MAG: sodium:solute symporter family protein [Acidobacteriota bacterium]|nr:sodium:solute symporter family protein [Acidobacteriota bacterium]